MTASFIITIVILGALNLYWFYQAIKWRAKYEEIAPTPPDER